MENNTNTAENYFSHKVRNELKRQNISRANFAEAAGIALNTLNSYLRNIPVIPNILTAVEIAKKLNVSLDYLCGTNDTKEISVPKHISVEILLKNLYQVINDTKLKISLDNDETVILITKNRHIYRFMQTILWEDRNLNINSITSTFRDLVVFNGELMDKATYKHYERRAYIYGDITDNDRETLSEECHTIIEQRTCEWNDTNGEPEKYLSEQYSQTYRQNEQITKNKSQRRMRNEK